jgi:hypothetical protein
MKKMKKYLSLRESYKSSNSVNLKIIGISLILIFISVLNSFSKNNCGGNLTAEFNRTIKTILNSEVTYTLLLKNTDIVTHEYLLKNINDNVSNPDGLIAEPRVTMNSVLLDSAMNILTKITLVPGGQIKFFLKLVVPENTSFDTWNCTEVLAEPEDCETVTLELYTFNPNPSNLE